MQPDSAPGVVTVAKTICRRGTGGSGETPGAGGFGLTPPPVEQHEKKHSGPVRSSELRNSPDGKGRIPHRTDRFTYGMTSSSRPEMVRMLTRENLPRLRNWPKTVKFSPPFFCHTETIGSSNPIPERPIGQVAIDV